MPDGATNASYCANCYVIILRPQSKIMKNNLSRLSRRKFLPLSIGTTHAFTGSTQRSAIKI
jgi:hypothetical protein